MSRIGKQPVPVPDKVTVTIEGRLVSMEGPAGKMSYEHRPEIKVEHETDARRLVVTRLGETREHKAYHGLTRSLLANLCEGCEKGYEKRLEVVGVGYLAAIAGDTLQLRVGFANEVHKKIPKELNVTCPDQTHIVVRGPSKQLVGQFAAEVRAARKPEPYKGKGVRYQGEQVKIKPGKSAT